MTAISPAPPIQDSIDVDRYTAFPDLGLSDTALDLGVYELKWYSLAYIVGIFFGYWYVRKLARQPGSPMAERHVDDLVFWSALGVILGGRLGYVLFYNLELYLTQGTTMFGIDLPPPLGIINLRDGGMSFHGGVIGVSLAILFYCRKHKLDWLRVHDYVACCVPVGLGLGRLANFVNGELWGGVTDVPWAIRFVEMVNGVVVLGPPRHPSQLYEALFEGLVLFVILAVMFWKTRARYYPGLLVGAFIFFYGVFRFGIEYFRVADAHLSEFAVETGLQMGQWLSLPMILGGLFLMATAKRRRQRVEPIAGPTSVA
ncbi:prolipoprotein diacylglyceryl transferase [Sphingomicrobium astaxanthinifaciens]|uniref:prolipoprotein diacylglyceryl transferase n=1 Tax=Sphingomicrobium astaxanthinifaciens TaxID=1227949 RepID=UPI001FCB453E|nr:prolipoprotein diacylglyceryl transferase [Sphingomicrobium astaxanthinifaciens]MCJ7421449.1 prolipoprotein diacylglyceryl transferase [Sphingomicrobium astaxanthinifaciens]